MKMIKLLVTALIFSAASGLVFANGTERPVYFVAQINITDQAGFYNGYVPEAFKSLPLGNGDTLVAVSQPLEKLEGTWEHNWNVVLKFPTRSDFLKFYHDDAYQQIAKPKRLASTDLNNIVLFEGADTAAFGDQPPVYFMAKIQIDDKEKFFGSYIPEVKKHVANGGGKVLFGGYGPEQLEGNWGDFWTIFIQFPSKEAFDTYYRSEGNLKVAIPIRYATASVNNAVVLQGVPEAEK